MQSFIGNTGTTTGTIIDGASSQNYYVTTPMRKKREVKDKFMNYSVHKPSEYRAFIIDEYEVKKVIKHAFLKNLETTYYFKKLWVTGLLFDSKKGKHLILEPFETMCRYNSMGNSTGNVQFCADEDELTTNGEVYEHDFRSKNLKKCFTKQEAAEQYIYMREKYEEKIDQEIRNMTNFLHMISKYKP